MAGESIAAGFVGFFLLIFFIWMIIIGLAIVSFIFWIFMIVDCAKRNFKQESDKIVWIIIIVLLQILGAIIYYFVIKKPDKH